MIEELVPIVQELDQRLVVVGAGAHLEEEGSVAAVGLEDQGAGLEMRFQLKR